MKLTPSSSARRKTFFAFSRSGGQPQIPSPVNRIAPNPSRFTKRSPANKNVSSPLLVFAAVAARSFGNPPVKTPAALAEIAPKNVLRLIADKICCRYQLSTLTCRAVALANQSSTDLDLSVARRLAWHAVLSRRSLGEGWSLVTYCEVRGASEATIFSKRGSPRSG